MCAPRLCCRHEPVSGPTLDYRSNHFKRIQSFGVSVTFILSLSSHWQFFLTITNRRFVFLTGAGYTILKKQKREKTEKKVIQVFVANCTYEKFHLPFGAMFNVFMFDAKTKFTKNDNKTFNVYSKLSSSPKK